ncbi:MAG: sulfur carrier protein ThiS [Chloroflexi bacterium]|nr:sulfur carrier protein ThiS [Chloroflexota bacterium]
MSTRAMITLTVNGKLRELQQPTSLLLFLEDHGVDSKFVAVAYNGTVLQKEEFPRITLGQGDIVEIVRPVGGG